MPNPQSVNVKVFAALAVSRLRAINYAFEALTDFEDVSTATRHLLRTPVYVYVRFLHVVSEVAGFLPERF
jgi:hypothetical protein